MPQCQSYSRHFFWICVVLLTNADTKRVGNVGFVAWIESKANIVCFMIPYSLSDTRNDVEFQRPFLQTSVYF